MGVRAMPRAAKPTRVARRRNPAQNNAMPRRKSEIASACAPRIKCDSGTGSPDLDHSIGIAGGGVPRLRPAAADSTASARRKGDLHALRLPARQTAPRPEGPPPRADDRRGHHLRRGQHRAPDGPVGSRSLREHDHRRGRLRDVDAGRGDHRRSRGVLRGDRPRRLSPVHADASARGTAHAGAGLAGRDAALGESLRGLVDARGHDARHTRLAGEDRGARHRRGRDRDVRGRCVDPVVPGDRGHLRRGDLWRRIEWHDGEMPPAAPVGAAVAGPPG